jgi:hypothetical protein
MYKFSTIIDGHFLLLRCLEKTALLDAEDPKKAAGVRFGLRELVRSSFRKVAAAAPQTIKQASEKFSILSSEQASHFMGREKQKVALKKATVDVLVLKAAG